MNADKPEHNVHYWAGRLLGDPQAYDIAAEIIQEIDLLKKEAESKSQEVERLREEAEKWRVRFEGTEFFKLADENTKLREALERMRSIFGTINEDHSKYLNSLLNTGKV